MASNDQKAVPNSDEAPENVDIVSKRDLLMLAEVLDIETLTVQRTIFAYLDKNDDAWFGLVAGKQEQEVTVQEMRDSLRRVSNTVFPLACPALTICREELPFNYYVKRPNFTLLGDIEEGTVALIPQMFLAEIQILEVLKQHPHRNVVRYHGCRVKHKRVTGIVLERYETSLHYHFRDKGAIPQVNQLMEALDAGVEHLHSLGLAHNDLNPTNIMIDKEDSPIIIDFDSCRRFGERLKTAGTPGWVDENYRTSERRNDKAALQKIEAWLNNKEYEQV